MSFPFQRITVPIKEINHGLNFRPALAKNSGSLYHNVMISWRNRAKIKISFANLRFYTGGPPSPKSNPKEHAVGHNCWVRIQWCEGGCLVRFCLFTGIRSGSRNPSCCLIICKIHAGEKVAANGPACGLQSHKSTTSECFCGHVGADVCQ